MLARPRRRRVWLPPTTCAARRAVRAAARRRAPVTASAARPSDLAVVLFTSGSTGAPKAVLHTQRGLAYKALMMVRRARPHRRRRRPHARAARAHLRAAQRRARPGRRRRCASCLMDAVGPRARARRSSSASAITFMIGPPTFFVALMAAPGFAPERVASLRLVSSGGAGRHAARSSRRRPSALGARVKRTYGSTEAPTITTSTRRRRRRRARARPTAAPVGAVRADDGLGAGDGELLAARARAVRRLRRRRADPRPRSTAGWFRTGDLATVDADGWLTIVGRMKDVIIRGGENIAAAEVEGVLEAHPAVREAVAVGYPDDRLGERVCVFVVSDGPFDLEDVPGLVRRARRRPLQDARARRARRRAPGARRGQARPRRAPRTAPPTSAVQATRMRSDDALAGLDRGRSSAVRRSRWYDASPNVELVELRALQEEVQVVLPREADAAVHLERASHHPLRRVASTRSSRSTPRSTRPGRRRRCTTRPSRPSSACPRRRRACRRSGASPPGTMPIGRPNCTRSLAYSTARSSARRRAAEQLGAVSGRAAVEQRVDQRRRRRGAARGVPSKSSQPSGRVRSIAGSAGGRPSASRSTANSAGPSASRRDHDRDVGRRRVRHRIGPAGRASSSPPAVGAHGVGPRDSTRRTRCASPAERALDARSSPARARARSMREHRRAGTAPARRGGRAPRAAPRPRPAPSPTPPVGLGDLDRRASPARPSRAQSVAVEAARGRRATARTRRRATRARRAAPGRRRAARAGRRRGRSPSAADAI